VNRTDSQFEQPSKQPPLPTFGVIIKEQDIEGEGPVANAPSKKPKPIKGVYEHPVDSGIWWINYYVEGRRHREKVGRRSDAVTLYQKRKTDARMGVKLPEIRPRRAVLFEEIAEDALVYSKEHKASYPGDRSTIGKLLPVFGKTPVTEITPQSIKAYLDTRDDLTKTTINRYRGTLSMIFQEAIRNGKVEQNPARLVRLHREDNGRVRFVTYEEEALIRRIVRERCPIHESELTLALETGMRRGEQYSLEWDRVDLERRQLLLLRTKNGTARVVILTASAVKALEELRTRRNPESKQVCLTRYGEPMISPRAWFELVMEEAIKKNPALHDVTWHIFRHTYISRLVMAGVDLRTVQELAGHKDIKMTTRYAHLAPSHKLAAVDRLAEHRRMQELGESNQAAIY
jgi:site-specific recombinase XerD